jgi:hypothetical protein
VDFFYARHAEYLATKAYREGFKALALDSKVTINPKREYGREEWDRRKDIHAMRCNERGMRRRKDADGG